MNRTAEIQAIEAHVESQGVYRCRMGECFYGDEGPSYRERMANSAKNGKRQRIRKSCETCGETFTVGAWEAGRKYCGRECSGIGAGAKRSRTSNVACDHCGKMHTRRRCQMKMEKKFCSALCANKHRVGRDGNGKKTEYNGAVYSSLSAAARAAGVTRHEFRELLNKTSGSRFA